MVVDLDVKQGCMVECSFCDRSEFIESSNPKIVEEDLLKSGNWAQVEITAMGGLLGFVGTACKSCRNAHKDEIVRVNGEKV